MFSSQPHYSFPKCQKKFEHHSNPKCSLEQLDFKPKPYRSKASEEIYEGSCFRIYIVIDNFEMDRDFYGGDAWRDDELGA